MGARLSDVVRTALLFAIERQVRVTAVLRGDADRGVPTRRIEGTPYQLVKLPDGRERVMFRVAEGTEQMVLLDRIILVLEAENLG